MAPAGAIGGMGSMAMAMLLCQGLGAVRLVSRSRFRSCRLTDTFPLKTDEPDLPDEGSKNKTLCRTRAWGHGLAPGALHARRAADECLTECSVRVRVT
ncbi:hypothetical protein BDP55DRAFT_366475 [Colletotrichum godetiae]|uniref:Uncharacterized protein n=1 Tax=Colletotrichum godetiae TaxID=1209918 RepID=A0AAJ0EQ20_9PEZI|nr:uncharacterized protein BDP55DRAFT_366475 [Colletotrichum godetiae]KAK1659162.1 hypothetical protein BDP55DRAFT_366475 [Colletotrichum godetiae]